MQTIVAHNSERVKFASDFTKNLAASKKRKDESGCARSLEKGRIEYPRDGWAIFSSDTGPVEASLLMDDGFEFIRHRLQCAVKW